MLLDLRRICVPTDFSPSADHAIHFGAALAEKFGADLHLLHVVRDPEDLVRHPDFTARNEAARAYFRRLEQAERPAVDEPSDAALDDSTREYVHALEHDVGRLFDQLPPAPWWEKVNVVRAVRLGHPVEEIRQYARHRAIQLLVVGSHGRTGLRRVLLGSVAEHLVQSSHCPILVVRHPQFDFLVGEEPPLDVAATERR